MPGSPVVMCHQSNLDRAGGRRRGLRRGRGCGRRCRRGGRWGRRGWGGCVATAARTGGGPRSSWWPGHRTCACASTRLDLLLCTPRGFPRSLPRDGRSSNVNGAAKVSVRRQIGFAANRNRPGHQRQASTFGEGRGGFPPGRGIACSVVATSTVCGLKVSVCSRGGRLEHAGILQAKAGNCDDRRRRGARRESPCPPSRRSSTAGRTCRRRRADESRRRSASMATSGRRAPPAGPRCWRSSSTSSTASGRSRSSAASSMSPASTTSRSSCPRCRAVGRPGRGWIEGVLARRPTGVIAVFSDLSEFDADPAPHARHPARHRRPDRRAAPRHAVDRGDQLERRADRDAPPARPRASPDRRRSAGRPRSCAAGPGSTATARRWTRPASRSTRPSSATATSTWRRGSTAAARSSALPDRPTAIFAGNDLQALGVYQAARELRLHIPEDLSVVGFDDLPVAKLGRAAADDGPPAAGRDGRRGRRAGAPDGQRRGAFAGRASSWPRSSSSARAPRRPGLIVRHAAGAASSVPTRARARPPDLRASSAHS